MIGREGRESLLHFASRRPRLKQDLSLPYHRLLRHRVAIPARAVSYSHFTQGIALR
jgi:hypothetical protein